MKSTLRLYEVSENYLSALNDLAEVDDLPPEAIVDTLEGLQGEFEDKALNVARYIRNLEAEADAITEAKKRMEIRARSASKQVARLKAYLKGEIERTGLKIKAADMALRVQNNPPSVVIEDESKVPTTYKEEVTSIKLCKSEIGKALKAGESIAGTRLERTTRLVIS